ncbi:MAG: hypothetical protein EXS05_23025 [Planctomycetaceae bacterium]|nr:hypothetical protein [Planctomycetaceae bacterium]
MAKAKVNKSALIREALAAHPEKSPIEISELLKTQGLKVPPQYVSTVKSMAKGQKKAKKLKRKAARASAGQDGIRAVNAAVEFIKSAGGLEAAKAALGTVETISKAL